MSDCGHDPLLLQALVDGELDAVHAAQVERQVADCADCAASHARLLALRAAFGAADLRVAAPLRLHRRVAESLAAGASAAPSSRPPRARPWPWMGAGAMLATAACAGLIVVGAQMRQTEMLTRELVAGHVRSLQAQHLTDVATSDQHVVKPWFGGKLDFSPPVPELADQGFPLVGGRLDYIDGRTVAAIVYRRGRHVINLFVWPQAQGDGPAEVRPGDGYALIHWRQGGMTFWAVSDVNTADLRTFEAQLRAKTPR